MSRTLSEDDTVSRQAVYTVIEEVLYETTKGADNWYGLLNDGVRTLPFVTPKRKTMICGACSFSDSEVLHVTKPPKIQCRKTGNLHFITDICDCENMNNQHEISHSDEDAVSRRRLLSDLKELTAAWKKYPVMAEQIKGVEAAIGYVETIPSVTPKTEQRWIPCSELPSDNREVEVTCEVRRCDGKRYRYTCHASYVHKYTIESTDYCDWEEADEYNEDEDKYYALPGWYERVHNWDDYSFIAIADFVTAWRELPEPYREEGEK